MQSSSSGSGGAGDDGFASVTVDHVVDGDTVDVTLDHRFTRVRVLQIDAPESSSTRSGRPDRCGPPATEYAKTLTHPGAHLTLEYAGDDRRDRFGRVLALVHLGDRHAITWEQRMVRAGWARVYVYDGNATPLLATLRADAEYARTHRLGVWAACDGQFHDPR
jgi:micrococcal nuclease